MANVIIYTALSCSYCERAKELLTNKSVEYTEIRVDEQQDKMAEMLDKSNGKRTVPQIFIGDEHIGGFDDLYALEQSGELDKLLEK